MYNPVQSWLISADLLMSLDSMYSNSDDAKAESLVDKVSFKLMMMVFDYYCAKLWLFISKSKQ